MVLCLGYGLGQGDRKVLEMSDQVITVIGAAAIAGGVCAVGALMADYVFPWLEGLVQAIKADIKAMKK